MAVNTIGKSNSAAYMRFFGEADVPALDRDSVVILDTQMNEKEAHLSRTNNFGKIGYGGPCPPSGSHRYFFKIFAIDTELDLQAGANKNQLLKTIEDHILSKGELMGYYQKRKAMATK